MIIQFIFRLICLACHWRQFSFSSIKTTSILVASPGRWGHILNPGDSVIIELQCFGYLLFILKLLKKSFLVPQRKLWGVQVKTCTIEQLRHNASSASQLFIPYIVRCLQDLSYFLYPFLPGCCPFGDDTLRLGGTELQWPKRAHVTTQRDTFPREKQSCYRIGFRILITIQHILDHYRCE